MEQQLTIFDVFKEMDASETLRIYENCKIPGVDFVECGIPSLKGISEVVVVDAESRIHLFGITVKLQADGCIHFSYSAKDRYWNGNYITKDWAEIKRSIANLVADIRKEWQVDESAINRN